MRGFDKYSREELQTIYELGTGAFERLKSVDRLIEAPEINRWVETDNPSAGWGESSEELHQLHIVKEQLWQLSQPPSDEDD